MSEMISVNKLVPHEKNNYLFDDIKDENWELFLDSVKNNGVIEPIVVVADTLVIISGHQRTRACIELGIENIHCRLKYYEEDKKRNISKEDVIIEELILTNLRQRGIGNTNPVKMGRCIKILEEIYDIKNGGKGGNRYEKVQHPINSDAVKNQAKLAAEIGMSQDTLNNYKKLTDLIPELQDLIGNKDISATIGHSIFAKMSPSEQKKMLDLIGIDNLKEMTIETLKKEIELLKNVKPTIIEKEVIVTPTDYDDNKIKIKTLESSLKNNNELVEKLEQQIKDKQASEQNIIKLEQKRKELAQEVIVEGRALGKIRQQATDIEIILLNQKEIEDITTVIKQKVIELEAKLQISSFDKTGMERLKNSIIEMKTLYEKQLVFTNKWLQVIDSNPYRITGREVI